MVTIDSTADAAQSAPTVRWVEDFFAAAGLGGHRLYGIEFDDGTVKVGRSTKVGVRFGEHANAAIAFGIKPGSAWISNDLGDFAARAEAKLIHLMAQHCTSRRRAEYFVGVTIADSAKLAEKAIALPTAGDGYNAINVATGHAVQDAIIRRGRTVSDVAVEAGMSRVTLYRKIAGKRAFTVPDIVSLARALHVDAASLVEFVEVAA